MASLPGRRWILALALALGGAPAASNAAPASVQFVGAVTALDPTEAPGLVPGVAIGDPITATLTFDDEAVSTGRIYPSTGAPFGIEVQVGSLTLSSAMLVNIAVMNDLAILGGGVLIDSYQAIAPLDEPILVADDALVISASDFTGAALSSDALPASAAALAGFPGFGFSYQIPGSGGPLPTPITVVQGSLSLVPEPARCVAIALAVLGARLAGRRRRPLRGA